MSTRRARPDPRSGRRTMAPRPKTERTGRRKAPSAAPIVDARFRVWFASARGQLLGPGRARLLEAVAREGSIAAAARALGMSYRKAWRLADTVNHAAERPLVERSRGGAGGGGATLTPFGVSVLRAFRQLERELTTVCQRHARRLAARLPLEGAELETRKRAPRRAPPAG